MDGLGSSVEGVEEAIVSMEAHFKDLQEGVRATMLRIHQKWMDERYVRNEDGRCGCGGGGGGGRKRNCRRQKIVCVVCRTERGEEEEEEKEGDASDSFFLPPPPLPPHPHPPHPNSF